jgi:imidazole glycerol-phosphate synthase subunit HisF
MLTKRIIPCLDIKDGRTVKGTNFVQLKDAGDPVELAVQYCNEGADELVFLDISATNENRKTLANLVRQIALHINIPFTVGGGVNSIADVETLLANGADKISINSSAVKNPNLISELSKNFGTQCIVVAMDIKYQNNNWNVYTNGGRIKTDIEAVQWAQQIEQLGGGEILLTSMDNDGTKNGFALDITKAIATTVNIPVIASGGAGKMGHFTTVFQQANADAALAASIFHYKEIEIMELKKYLAQQNIAIRI